MCNNRQSRNCFQRTNLEGRSNAFLEGFSQAAEDIAIEAMMLSREAQNQMRRRECRVVCRDRNGFDGFNNGGNSSFDDDVLFF